MNGQVYLNEVLLQAPRLLGLLNRNPLSKTYGCFDRQYWHYNASDFASARLQEAILTLALLYKINDSANPYFNRAAILGWINAGLRFWTTLQRHNGTFDEWYPGESSFVATAFSSYAVSEAVLQLGGKVEQTENIVLTLRKAGDWLSRDDDLVAVNQQAGSAIALYNIYLLTGDRRFEKSASRKLERILVSQSEEGWFPEYGGPDIGYLSLTVDYLAKYYQKTRDQDVLDSLEKTVDFIGYFLHPDNTTGGEYGSRNTEYLMPHGFEILAKELPEANIIANHIKNSIKSRAPVSLFSLDDRYLSQLAYTYLQAHLDQNSYQTSERPRYTETFSRFFSEAGIWIYSDEDTYLIANCRKGANFKLFFKVDNTAVYDSGIAIKTVSGKRLVSGWLSDKNQACVSEASLEVKGNFAEPADDVLSPLKNVLLRLFGLTLGRIGRVGLLVKGRLRKKLITGASSAPVKFCRRVSVEAETIIVTDKISKTDELEQLLVGLKASYIYIPSSRYFQISELNSLPTVYRGSDLARHTDSGEIVLTRQYDKTGKLIRQSVR